MALKSEFMASGQPGQLAKMEGFDAPVTGLVSAGSASTDATAITSSFSVFATVGSNEGARLPTAGGKGPFVVINSGANALKVYPAAGEKINNGTATTGSFSVTNAKQAIFLPAGNQWFAALSA